MNVGIKGHQANWMKNRRPTIPDGILGGRMSAYSIVGRHEGKKAGGRDGGTCLFGVAIAGCRVGGGFRLCSVLWGLGCHLWGGGGHSWVVARRPTPAHPLQPSGLVEWMRLRR
jgi:hypothetical protein